jgi:uncharacterized protein YkwD
MLVSAAPLYAAWPNAPGNLQVGGFSGGRIRVAWTDNAHDETSFHLERSLGSRNAYTLIATLAANTTTYTDAAVALDTTYWYRVRACNGSGCSAYSRESYSVAFAAESAPNLDERYLLFLINETRASPAAYGYPEQAPRPPVAYNALLNFAAHAHSQAILNSDFQIGHCYPDPRASQPDVEFRCPSERARDVGYNGGVSENLIAGGDGWQAAEDAHRAFLSSGGHRDNILDPNAREAGVGHAYDPNKGSDWHGQYTYNFCGWNPVTLPALPSGIVVPYWGRRTTSFSFLVNFYNASGGGPTQASVVIDGMARPMSLRRGAPANGSYAYTTTLPPGSHSYFFEFRYGSGQIARLPASGAYSGPDVETGKAVLDVPAEYPSLAAALAHARGDVIVRLATGTFHAPTSLHVPTEGIWIEGAGVDRTIVRGSGAGHVLEVHVDALIRDLTITNSGTGYFEAGIWNTSGRVELRNVRLAYNNVGVFTWCFEPNCGAVVTITGSILDHNVRAAVDANEPGVHRLINSTIVANGAGVILNNTASQLENSLVVHNTGAGVAGRFAPTIRYNDVWGNGRNYQDVGAGQGDMSMDPRFENEAASDYRLRAGSPCVDAGNPHSASNDRNGTRNDVGAYGGPYGLWFIESRATSPGRAPGAFVVSWQGNAADGIQSYDIQYQIRTTGAWRDWLMQTTSVSAQFGPASPVSLAPGGVYCFRARARDRAGHVEPYPSQADACTMLPPGHQTFLPIILTP